MRFDSTLDHGARGHFNRLDLDKHVQYERDGRVHEHKLPEHPTFAFVAVPEWA